MVLQIVPQIPDWLPTNRYGLLRPHGSHFTFLARGFFSRALEHSPLLWTQICILPREPAWQHMLFF